MIDYNESYIIYLPGTFKKFSICPSSINSISEDEWNSLHYNSKLSLIYDYAKDF